MTIAIVDRRTLDQIEFDLMVAERLDDAVPCDGNEAESCPLDARWSYTHGCGQVWLLCTPHRVLMERHFAKLLKRRKVGSVGCAACFAPLPSPIPWLPL